MPKTSGTRREAAHELRRRLRDGPAISFTRVDDTWDHPDRGFAAQYKLWSESWILPEIDRLIPELKPKK